MTSKMARALSILTVLASLASVTAARAQQGASSSQPAQTPFTVEEIGSGFVIAPDAKFTQVNDRSATLAGVYGGWMLDHTVMFGAGGYWLANGSHDFEMVYGGPVVEWLVNGDRRIGFGVRGLVGGGTSTISGTAGDLFGVSQTQPDGRTSRGGHPGARGDGRLTPSTRVIAHEDFFIAEPQAVVSLRATPWLHIDAGVGYRLIAGANGLDDRLHGATGTISVQFGGGGS